MRVIDGFEQAVRTASVSPDGRFLAAAAGFTVAVWDWQTGAEVLHAGCSHPVGQLAFTADGGTVVFATGAGLARLAVAREPAPRQLHAGSFSGGIAISPDGKTLVATRAGYRQQARLEKWDLPTWRPATGFDFWSPFRRLAFSPNGEFLAGIDNDSFELRFAVSGGQNGRYRVRYVGEGFFAFPRDSRSVAFGWETDLHVMETRNGGTQRRITSPDRAFADAAFLGNGGQLATVDGSPLMRVWSANSWSQVRGYDWGVGGLTCVTVTADGLTGVCGSDTGKLVVFDVDE